MLEKEKVQLVKQLADTSEQLRQTELDTSTLSASRSLSTEKFESISQENSCFLSEILKLQENVVSLKQERESLLATISFMQEELSRSENMRRHNSTISSS